MYFVNLKSYYIQKIKQNKYLDNEMQLTTLMIPRYFIFLFLLLNWLFIKLELVISFFYLAYIFFNLHYRLGLFPHLLYLDIINLLVYQKPRTLKHFFSKPYFLLKFQNVENQAINFLIFVFFPQLYLFS